MYPTDSSPPKNGPDSDTMAGRIPPARRDREFFYAAEIRHDARTGEWTVRVEPDECLTGYADVVDVNPPIKEISDRGLASRSDGPVTTYEGPVLLSAGVILCVDDRFVLFERDAEAPVDPLRWTSPAGRCDTTPTRTALTELYEELLVTADGRAGVVVPPNRDPYERVYAETLRHNGIDSDPENWVRLPTELPEQFDNLYARVTTTYGDHEYAEEFWPFLDENNATLELRKIFRIDGDDADALRFEDAEYDRRTSVLTGAELASMDDDDLVPTNRAFRDAIGADL